MRKFDPAIEEKYPLKVFDRLISNNDKTLPTRDIMDDIKLIKRLADYMNTSISHIYNQTKTAIDYYTGEDGLEDFQDMMRETTLFRYDEEFLERLILEWDMNEEQKWLELGPEAYWELYDEDAIARRMEEEYNIERPYTFESLLWDLYILWMEMFITCQLYVLARPELKEIEHTIVKMGVSVLLSIKRFFSRTPKTTDELINDDLMFYCQQLARRAAGEPLLTKPPLVLSHPSNFEILLISCKENLKLCWYKIIEYIQ
uniref:Uncharacterized protein orf257 n=1 Tax=Heterostelium pallidum TaxID=13642 RepID=Q5ILI7_HETPA|nr:hypothetical protein PopaoMp39 [Heterostelium pallidum]AAU00623.1 unknown [Heterostelium pallidum]